MVDASSEAEEVVVVDASPEVEEVVVVDIGAEVEEVVAMDISLEAEEVLAVDASLEAEEMVVEASPVMVVAACRLRRYCLGLSMHERGPVVSPSAGKAKQLTPLLNKVQHNNTRQYMGVLFLRRQECKAYNYITLNQPHLLAFPAQRQSTN